MRGTRKKEAENKRLLLLLAAEKAAMAAKVFAPGYGTPMTRDEHLHALQRQIHYAAYLQELHLLHLHATPAQCWADRAITRRQRPLTLRRPSGRPAVRHVRQPATNPQGGSTLHSPEHLPGALLTPTLKL